MRSDDKAPRETWIDKLMDAIELAGTVHPLAAPAAVLISKIFGRPVERRRIQFLDRLAERLHAVEDRIGSIPSLAERPEVVSALLKSLEIADRTHEKEKLDALRNAVVNVAAKAIANETKIQTFLASLDELTAAHLITLRVLSSEQGIRSMRRFPTMEAAVSNAVFDDASEEDLAQLLCLDLERRGFLKPIWTASIIFTPEHLGSDHTTSLGREFLRFIAESESNSEPS